MSKPKILELEDELKQEKTERKEKNVIVAYQTSAQIANQNQTCNLQGCSVIGDKLTLSNNEVVIGKGISVVEIAAQIFFEYIPDVGYFSIEIRKNGTTVGRRLNDYRPGATYYTATVACPLLEVEEGDKITLNFGDINSKQPTTRHGELNTYMSVKEIK